MTYKRKDRKFMDKLAAMRDRLTNPKWMGARIAYRLFRDYN